MFGGDDSAFGARPRVSGNSFANGSNQNCGNVLSDTPSTRVAAPPGGRSSICLGWDNSPEEPVQRGGRRGGYHPAAPMSPAKQGYSSYQEPHHAPIPSPVRAGAPGNDDQAPFGRRNRETSNSYACGSNQNQGNHLTDVPTTRVLRPPGGSSDANLLSWDDKPQRQAAGQPPQARPGYEAAGQPRPGSDARAFGQRQRESSNSFANGGNQNCGNMMTDTPTTRVLRPPGGHSSLTLG